MIVVLVTDLIFRSRISATARAAGVLVNFVRNMEEYTALAASGSIELMIVDMDLAGANPLEVINRAAANHVRPRIVVYLSHVQAELAKAAAAAGADLVLPRSAFVQQLAEILAGARRVEPHAAT